MRRKPFEYPPPPECHEPFAMSRETLDGVTRCSGCKKALLPEELKRVSSERTSKQGIPSQWNNVPPRRPNNSFEAGPRLDERSLPYRNERGDVITYGNPIDMRKYKPSIKVS